MKRSIITTADGSKTIQIEDWNEQYPPCGALRNKKHVYIENGLHEFLQRQPNPKAHQHFRNRFWYWT